MLALRLLKRLPLAIGWWGGVLIGAINFSSLVLSLKRSKEVSPQGAPEVTRMLGPRFFVRYLFLASAFFLVLQLGRGQFESSLVSFVSFYGVIFLGQLVTAWKQKASGANKGLFL